MAEEFNEGMEQEEVEARVEGEAEMTPEEKVTGVLATATSDIATDGAIALDVIEQTISELETIKAEISGELENPLGGLGEGNNESFLPTEEDEVA